MIQAATRQMSFENELLSEDASVKRTPIRDYLGNLQSVRYIKHGSVLWFSILDITVASGSRGSNVTHTASKASRDNVITAPSNEGRPLKFVNLKGLYEISERSLKPHMGVLYKYLFKFALGDATPEHGAWLRSVSEIAPKTALRIVPKDRREHTPQACFEPDRDDEAVLEAAVAILKRRVDAQRDALSKNEQLLKLLSR